MDNTTQSYSKSATVHNYESYSPALEEQIQTRLNKKLDLTDISFRPANGGTVAYLEGWRAISHANETFGFNGWSSEIITFTIDFVDVDLQTQRTSVGVSCIVRVCLKDGTFHEDVGYGIGEGMKGRGMAFEKARKEAVTDALKRTLRIFGDRLGNCAYDKEFLRNVKKSAPSTAASNYANYPNTGIAPNSNCSNDSFNKVSNIGLKNASANKEAKENLVQPIKKMEQEIPINYTPTWKSAKDVSNSHPLPLVNSTNNPPSDFAYDDFPMYDDDY